MKKPKPIKLPGPDQTDMPGGKTKPMDKPNPLSILVAEASLNEAAESFEAEKLPEYWPAPAIQKRQLMRGQSFKQIYQPCQVADIETYAGITKLKPNLKTLN